MTVWIQWKIYSLMRNYEPRSMWLVVSVARCGSSGPEFKTRMWQAAQLVLPFLMIGPWVVPWCKLGCVWPLSWRQDRYQPDHWATIGTDLLDLIDYPFVLIGISSRLTTLLGNKLLLGAGWDPRCLLGRIGIRLNRIEQFFFVAQ